ncbi:MAG: SGNH/GDSL hydrolase family protein [Candidatus Saccharimonadales bacterium]
MHKLLSMRVVLALATFIIAPLAVSVAKADDSLPWLSSPLSLQARTDTSSLPPAWNNNIDCIPQDTSTCTVSTLYGAVNSSSSARLNDYSAFHPVISYIDNRQHFLPVPNSKMAITYITDPVYGFYLYFNHDFTSGIRPTLSFGSTSYQMVQPPDGKLTDKSGQRLAADYTSMSFSQNNQWMVVSEPNVAVLRVNLETFEVVPFAPGFNYAIGLSPSPKTAISNDGRYITVASKDFSSFKIYDLNTCGPVPNTISGPVSCQSRDLQGFMQQQLPGYSSTSYIRFLDDNHVVAYSSYSSNGSSKTTRFIIGNGDTTNQIDYLALGDSYISGEGAFDYVAGTDTSTNKCHLSYLSYPLLIGQDLGYGAYHSVACAGAKTEDITNTSAYYESQADRIDKATRALWDKNGQSTLALTSFLPGYIDQMDFVTTYQPKAITMSLGGNNMGFSSILKSCVDPRDLQTCYSTYEDRLELVRLINHQVFPRLVQTYQQLKAAGAPDMRIYVIGYPQIAKPGGDCAINVHLNNDELVFAQQLISYLDQVISSAAAKAGVYYTDTRDALNGHRLCEADLGQIAMNGLTAGNDTPINGSGPIGDESYHPNPLGYQLLEDKVLAVINNLTSPMPPANLTATPPTEEGLEILNAPHSGRAINNIEYDNDVSADLAYQQTPLDILIDSAQHSLAPNTTLRAELHSTPISLGSYKTGANGDLTTQVTIPADTPTGYHTLHFYGADMAGQSIDIYKFIYVAHAADDLDGDGVLDSIQSCVGVASSGQDYDQDGIDDACDGTIDEPPVQNEPVSIPESGIVLSSTDAPDVSNTGSSIYATSQEVSNSQSAVLGANTTAASSVNKPASSDNLKIPGRYYLIAGGAFLLLTIVSYFIKQRL